MMAKKRDYASPFQSDLVTLLVGYDEERFTVHQEVVTKARYFAGCLKSSFQESHTKIVKFPTDEPAVIAKVLDPLQREDRNKLMDLARDVDSMRWISVNVINLLLEYGLGQFLMARFLLRSLANALLIFGWGFVTKKQEAFHKLVDGEVPFAGELLKACTAVGTTKKSNRSHNASQLVNGIWIAWGSLAGLQTEADLANGTSTRSSRNALIQMNMGRNCTKYERKTTATRPDQRQQSKKLATKAHQNPR